MLLPHLLSELRSRVDSRVDLAADPILRLGQSVDHLAERHVADHEQIDVARALFGSARDRAENERADDAIAERLERVADDVRDASGLDHEPAELLEHGARPVRLVMNLPAADAASQDACSRELLELALHDPRAAAHEPHDSAHVERFIGPAIGEREHPLPGLAEERRCEA